eukprot:49473-Rhodomonas_salina.4
MRTWTRKARLKGESEGSARARYRRSSCRGRGASRNGWSRVLLRYERSHRCLVGERLSSGAGKGREIGAAAQHTEEVAADVQALVSDPVPTDAEMLQRWAMLEQLAQAPSTIGSDAVMSQVQFLQIVTISKLCGKHRNPLVADAIPAQYQMLQSTILRSIRVDSAASKIHKNNLTCPPGQVEVSHPGKDDLNQQFAKLRPDFNLERSVLKPHQISTKILVLHVVW